jgi:hypothetical protein
MGAKGGKDNFAASVYRIMPPGARLPLGVKTLIGEYGSQVQINMINKA